MLELHASGAHRGDASGPAAELMKEDEEEEEEGEGVEEDKRKSLSSTCDLAPGQVPVLQWAMPTTPDFWVCRPKHIRWVGGGRPLARGPRGKAPTMEVVPLPPEMDQELVHSGSRRRK